MDLVCSVHRASEPAAIHTYNVFIQMEIVFASSSLFHTVNKPHISAYTICLEK